MKGLKGSVNQRSASWQALLSYKKEDGTWGKRSKACKTKTEALQVLKGWNVEESEGITQENPTLEKIRDLWIREKKLSGANNSITTYLKTSDLILQYLNKPVKDVKREDIVEFFFALKDDGLEIDYPKRVLSMIFNYAISKKIITQNPTRGIRITRTNEKRKPIILTESQRINILSQLEGGLFYYPVLIDFITGLRKGELCGLKWSYLDLMLAELEVAEQYTVNGQTDKLKSDKSYRTMDLDELAITTLNELRGSEFSDSEYVFAEHEYIFGQMYKCLSKFGIVPHDLRHNHATDLLDVMNHADAADRMGHTVEEYIKTYVHSSKESRKKAVQKLSKKYQTLSSNKPVTSNVINFAKR